MTAPPAQNVQGIDTRGGAFLVTYIAIIDGVPSSSISVRSVSLGEWSSGAVINVSVAVDLNLPARVLGHGNKRFNLFVTSKFNPQRPSGLGSRASDGLDRRAA